MCSDTNDNRNATCIDCESCHILPAYIRSPKDNNITIAIRDERQPADSYYVIMRCEDCGSVFLNPYYFNESANLYNNVSYFGEYFPDNIHTGGGPKLESARFESYSRWVNKRQARKFLRMANLPLVLETQTVDLGCAKGDLVLGFVDCGCGACGVDISYQMVQAALKRGVKAAQGRFEDIELPANSVDLVTSIEVFEHMSDLEAVLNKVRQVLKPDGVLIIQVPNDIEGYRRYLFRNIWWMIPPMHIRYFTSQNVNNIFRRHGFQITQISTCGSIGADIGRIVTWYLKQHGMDRITKTTPYRYLIKVFGVSFFLADWALNILKKHSEMIVVMRKLEV